MRTFGSKLATKLDAKNIWAGHNCVGRCPTDASASRCDAVSVWAWMHPTGLWMHNVWRRCTCRSGACSASLCTATTAVHCVPRTQYTRSMMAFELGHGRPASKHRVTPPHCAACAAARSEVTKATAPPQHTCLSRTYPIVPSRGRSTAMVQVQHSNQPRPQLHTHCVPNADTHSAHAARHLRIRNMASYLPITWCFKASRDCTSHGDAPQTRFRQQIQNATRSPRTHTTAHAHTTRARTEGASMIQRGGIAQGWQQSTRGNDGGRTGANTPKTSI
jgi:hypothetical protein